MSDVVTEARTASDAALRYAITPLAFGVRRALGAELWKLPRAELIPRLQQTFGGSDDLKAALQDAFERAIQSIVVGLKAPWLLMETGDRDYCAAFSERVRAPFVQEAGIDGRLLIDFLDTFFLEHDSALDAARAILGIADLEDEAFFERLLDAGDGSGDANELAAKATQAIRDGFVSHVGFEEEHPIVRLAQWRDLFADGLIFHAADIARAHPSWSRYLDLLDEEKLARQDMRAAAERDEPERGRVALARGLLSRIESYRTSFGDVIPNREWLFELAERLEDSDENVESELLQGRPMQSRDLPVLVKAALGKAQQSHGVSRIVRAADALVEPRPITIEVLRRARRDFRRCHWQGEGYADAALDLGSLMFAVLGPRGSERYLREALAFGGDKATAEYALYMASLALDDKRSAIHHLQAAIAANPEQFEPFDGSRYELQTILGAGGAGVSFLVTIKDGKDAGKDAVVKTLWDEIAVTDPRPALKELQALDKARIRGVAKIIHLCGYKKRATFVVSDFVEGDDLESFREAHGGEAAPSVTAEIGWRAADVLARAHAAGVVHRNLKPGNVRVGAGEEGLEVSLLDFAIPNYVLAHEGRIRGVRRLAAWSRLGRAIAEDLAAYNAPEVLKGGVNAATPSSDVYSLAATLYRLATGASPRKIDPEGIPAAFRDLLMRCLDRSPEKRPRSADEVRDALRVAAERLAREGEDSQEQPALTEQHEDEFGLKNLNPNMTMLDDLSGADQFAPPVAPPPAPSRGRDPGRTQLEGETLAPSGGTELFSPGSSDPFAPQGTTQFAPGDFGAELAPAGDAFAPTGDAFAPAGDPFAPAGDAFAPAAGAPAGFAPQTDPFAPADDPFAPRQPGGADAFAPQELAPDPFAPQGGASADPFAPQGLAPDPFAPADPFAPQGDPFAPQGEGAPFGLESAVAPSPAKKAPARPTRGRPAAEEGEEALDPNEALMLLEQLLAKRPAAPAKKPAKKRAPPPPDPFAASDMFAAAPPAMQASHDPLMAGDPFAPQADPFAPVPDPFAPSGSGVVDPFAAQASGAMDPFAPQASGAMDPFAPQPGGVDPFAAQPGADPFGASGVVDPFAAPVDPFAQGAAPDPFAQSGTPFLSAEGDMPADLPNMAVPDDLPTLDASAEGGLAPPPGMDELAPPPGMDELEPAPAPAPRKPGGKPAGKPAPGGKGVAAAKGGAPARKGGGAPAAKVDEDGYGLVISGLGLKSKKEAAIKILMEVRGISMDEAQDLCRSPVVPVLKRVSREEALAAEEKFKAAKINCRVTERKDRR